MSAALDIVATFAVFLIACGLLGALYWLFEVVAWQIEKRRRSREVLPEPNCRTVIRRRWQVPL
jgi:hypothetical protein